MAFTTPATVAAYLGVTFTGAQMAQAAALVPAAEAAIQRHCDRIWASTPIVGEVHVPDGPLLYLRQAPVASIQSVVGRWYFGATVAFTQGSDYRVRDAATGLLVLNLWRTGRPTDRPYETIEVDYTPDGLVPADVALAATQLVAEALQPSLSGDGNAEAPGAVIREQVGDVAVQYATTAPAAATALPASVQALLAPYRARLVFA